MEQDLVFGFNNFTVYWKGQNTADGDKGMFASKRERGVLTEDRLSSLENRNLKALEVF